MSAPDLKGATQFISTVFHLVGIRAQWAQDSQVFHKGFLRIGKRGLQIKRCSKPCWKAVGRD